jgi:hypothetical protein
MSDITPAFVRRLLAAAVKQQSESRLLALLGSAVDHASDLGDEEGLQLAAAAIETAQVRDVAAPTFIDGGPENGDGGLVRKFGWAAGSDGGRTMAV